MDIYKVPLLWISLYGYLQVACLWMDNWTSTNCRALSPNNVYQGGTTVQPSLGSWQGQRIPIEKVPRQQ